MDHADWGRWNWKDTGPGRYHAIVSVGVAAENATGAYMAVVKLACGRIRQPPNKVEHEPPREQCCPECLTLDDMRRRYADHSEAPKEKVPA